MSSKLDTGDARHLSELRIVLMGYKGAGKSSSGNTILGRDEFDLKSSAQCVRRHGEVADRHITVIEAPGWWMNLNVERSTERLKQEIVLSVSLCPPGPHAVLLIIPVRDRFKETERKALQDHLDLLGERVWSHTIVLFTFGDFLSDTSIEQYIESEGHDLQRLLDKCGNRYHVLNNLNRRDDTQIEELLEKIEETVALNNSRHFEMDGSKEADERLDKWREDMRLQTMSGAEGSYTVYSSFRPRSGADPVFSSSSSRDSSHTIYTLVTINRYNSMDWIPPNMSGDERSDTKSLGSSAYGSFISLSGADSDSVFSLHSKASSHSSGFGSLRSIPESVEGSGTRRTLALPKISKLFPRRLKQHEEHEEDTKKT